MAKRILAILSLAVLFGCAHHRDVRPGADGIHRVVVQAEDGDQGGKEAIRQAQHFCEERKLSAAFIDENKKYTGDMDEETYKTTKRVGKVAKVVGGGVWTFGGKRESTIGGIGALGGAAADAAAGEGYTIEMRFKCM